MDKKVVVITGASSGIGASLAQSLGARGARVVLAARREAELRQVASRSGADALPVVTDVTRREDVQRLLDTALGRFGQVDVWVNNAGRGISKLVSQLTDEDLDEMMLTNVKSALYGMQAVLPHFQARGKGHLINVSSMLGRVPYVPIRSAYNAAKHALNALTANLRQEVRERFPGIHVSTVMPGPVATDFGTNALGGGHDSRLTPGAQSAEEVAAVIVELIEHPRGDAYTRPEFAQRVLDYYTLAETGAAEGAAAPKAK